MSVSKILPAALLAISTIFPGTSFAAPSSPALSADDGLVIQVRGCHRNPERHFVPEFGERAWHVHRGDRCRPVEVDGPDFDDDDDRGGRDDDFDRRDCHREARRHFLPGYGNVWHRHGRGCRPEVFRRHDGGGPRPGVCMNVGGATLCLD